MATNYEQTIWNYLKAKINNEYGVAGLMGNLYAESGLRPNNLENTYETSLGFTDESYTNAVDNGSYSESQFVNDSAGYGLAQWTWHTRKQKLYDLYKSGGYSSIGNINLQLDYLWYELENNYSGLLSILKSCTSIRTASDKVLHDFENPADQSTSVEEYRCELGTEIYNRLKGSGSGGSGGVIIPTTKTKSTKFNFVLFNQNRRKQWIKKKSLNRLR